MKIQERRGSLFGISIYVAIPLALFAVAGLWFFRIPLFHDNFHMVIQNEVYRSAQLSAEALDRRIKEFSLRSVINLRTNEKTRAWLKDEQVVSDIHGVDLHLIRLSVFMPPRGTLRELVHLLNTAKRPLLLHCEMGVERSGIASAISLLLSGRTIAEARKQFSLPYGFVPLICQPDLPKMLDNYEHWLVIHGWAHTPERFRRWVEDEYVPYFYRAQIEPLDVPTSINRSNGALMRFRATNISPQPWMFRSDRDSGVHLGAKVHLSQPSVKQEIELRGGFRDLTVAPGESVVLELEIPPSLKPGHYHFFVDLVDERVKWFSDMGSEPITFDLSVEDPDTLSGIRGRGRP